MQQHPLHGARFYHPEMPPTAAQHPAHSASIS